MASSTYRTRTVKWNGTMVHVYLKVCFLYIIYFVLFRVQVFNLQIICRFFIYLTKSVLTSRDPHLFVHAKLTLCEPPIDLQNRVFE